MIDGFGCGWRMAGGRSLLMLLPSEKEAMLRQLEEAKIPIKPLKINPNKTQPIGPALQALLSKSNELKVRPPTVTHPNQFNRAKGSRI